METTSLIRNKLPEKGDYFYDDDTLYYVVDILEQHYLIENCLTLDIVWFSVDVLSEISIIAREEVTTC